MDIIYATLCGALCIASGSAYHYGPLNNTVEIGEINEPSPEDVVASNNLIGLLEYIQRLMPVGVADFVPSMEPYVCQSIFPAVFDDPDSPLNGTVELSNLVVSGAQDFTINDIRVQTESERVEFDITLPEVIADLPGIPIEMKCNQIWYYDGWNTHDAHYTLAVDYTAVNFVYDDHFVFNVSGHVQITLVKLNVAGVLCAKPLVQKDVLNPYYEITGLHVTNSADDVQSNVDATSLPAEIINELKDVLFVSVAQTAIDEMGGNLIHFTQKQVLTL